MAVSGANFAVAETGTVVVLESGRSRKDESRALVRALEEAGLEILGCVLNRYKPELPTWIGGS